MAKIKKIKVNDTVYDVGAVTGVKGNSESSYRTGDVNITAANIGLGNVSNTSDANKPVSTAQQTAINNALSSAKTYADEKVANLVNNSTAAVDSITELAAAMENNADAIEALESVAAGKADANHSHDDMYYTESEIDGKVSGLQADIDGKVAELQADIDGHSHSWSTVSDKPPYMIGKREVLYQGTHQFTEYSGGNLSTSTMYDIYEAIDEGSLSYYDLVEFVVDKYSIVCSIPEAPSIPLGGVEQGIEYMYHLGTIFVNGSLDLESGKSYNVSINRLPLYPELEMWLSDNGYVPYQTIAGSFASKSEMNRAMAKKADTTHTHAIADVTNLQTTLDSLQASIDSVDIESISIDFINALIPEEEELQ